MSLEQLEPKWIQARIHVMRKRRAGEQEQEEEEGEDDEKEEAGEGEQGPQEEVQWQPQEEGPQEGLLRTGRPASP